MRIRSQALQRRRAARQGRKVAKRQHRIEKEMAKQTEWRHRDEHTGGYGDSPLDGLPTRHGGLPQPRPLERV